MSNPSQRPEHLFVVRTWQEKSSVVPGGEWRGSVEHIPTGQRLYFTSMQQLNRFIISYTGRTFDGESTPDTDEAESSPQ